MTILRNINLAPAKVAHEQRVRRVYWAIWTKDGYLPASLHNTRHGAIRRGIQVCFPVEMGRWSTQTEITKTWRRLKRGWGYRCERVSVTPNSASADKSTK